LFDFFQLSVFFTPECNFAILEFNLAILKSDSAFNAFTIFILKFSFVDLKKVLLDYQFFFIAGNIYYCFPKNYLAHFIPTHKTFFLSHLSNFPKQDFIFLNHHFHFLIKQLNFINLWFNFLIHYFLHLFFISHFYKLKIHFPYKIFYFLLH